MEVETQERLEQFAIFAIRKSENTSLVQTDLAFGRLMEDIIIPFDTGEMFFIDGAPVKADELDRIKIIRQNGGFKSNLHGLHRSMRHGADTKKQEIYARQYHIRLEAILRESGEDVTSQIIKAFRTEIKPGLKDYVPNKEAMLSAAVKVFAESMKLLSGA